MYDEETKYDEDITLSCDDSLDSTDHILFKHIQTLKLKNQHKPGKQMG